MRRSDAIKTLEQDIYNWETNTGIKMSLPEFVIRRLELMGMSPPEFKASFNLEKQDGSSQKSYTLMRRWENE